MRRALAALAFGLAAAVSGCGGSVGVGGTGSYSYAPIEGFGSIYVGGIEYDDSQAAVFDEDGAAIARDSLRLGMVVEVEGGEIGGSEAAPTAQALRIRTATELVGLASAVNVAADTLKVFEQTVRVDASTLFDASLPDGLASVAEGAALEVFGSYDVASTSFLATRIAPRAGTLAEYRVRGPVQDLDAAARSFRIGAALFSYEGAQPLLAEGAWLRVRADTVPSAGRWKLSGAGVGMRSPQALARVRLRGPITRYASDVDFDLNGQRVDARGAAFDGHPGDLALGKAVEVDGVANNGVIVATRVRLDDHGGAQGSITLQGTIGALDSVAKTFVLRGSTVSYGANGVQFDGGSEADLANGRAVTVKAVSHGHDTLLTARRIAFN